MQISIRDAEGCAPQPFLLWDTVWSGTTQGGDWALAGAGEPLNRGGLQSRAALATAVILALFTDRRCPPDHPLARFADDDPRGWWGDGLDVRDDLGEAPLGSLLWLLERASVLANTEQWARSLAEEALAPLLQQGAVAAIQVTTAVLESGHGLTISVGLAGHDGSIAYDGRFEVVWDQIG